MTNVEIKERIIKKVRSQFKETELYCIYASNKESKLSIKIKRLVKSECTKLGVNYYNSIIKIMQLN
jgi:hypothetical protein